jgi:hypothetical protein
LVVIISVASSSPATSLSKQSSFGCSRLAHHNRFAVLVQQAQCSLAVLWVPVISGGKVILEVDF